ncbi:MAG TPA: STAS domain-containing protein [Verrucomicrobiae bacterium]|jgi:anti-anti-sigma regulatory factor|nr:STAS domain-containing protein [Verrucomicrobiae bacterium]
MSTSSAKMLVFVGAKCVCIKISGRANFTSSIDFKTLVNELMQQGRDYFVLDLSECTLMDSTFLGVLAGFGLKVNSPQPNEPQRTIELFNPNARISDLLENLGVLHLFKVQQGAAVCLPEETAPHDLTPANPSRETVTQTCLEAHRTLMDLHPDNVARFKDVAAFLAEDLKKLKAAGSS